MPAQLPDDYDCRRLLAEGGVTGAIAGGRLRRVAPPYRVAGSASVELRCRADARGIAVSGSVRAPLEAQCQRCLAWMPLPVTAAVDVIAAAALPAQREDDEDEYILIEDGKLRLLELIEDELLLNCPMVPAHDPAICADAMDGAGSATSTRKKPFAALAELLEKKPEDSG